MATVFYGNIKNPGFYGQETIPGPKPVPVKRFIRLVQKQEPIALIKTGVNPETGAMIMRQATPEEREKMFAKKGAGILPWIIGAGAIIPFIL